MVLRLRFSKPGAGRGAAVTVITILGLAGCAEPTPVSAPIGEPLPGLTADELSRFEAGRAVFAHPFSPDEGVGPRFNENACNACHTFPSDGGTGETNVRRATRTSDAGVCDPLAEAGGENLRIQVTPVARDLGAEPVRAPVEAHHRAAFTIPFLFGVGLVDAIPQATLDALADPDDLDGDGISGRVGRDAAGRPARFGRKADVASLRDFTDTAFRMEMGITTPGAPDERLAGALPPVPPGADPAPDPEIDATRFDLVVDFMRFLAPPEPADPERDPVLRQGRSLFGELGCRSCHVPVLRAGPDPSPAIARRRIALFSDLLLHDMGPSLAGTCAPGATTTEYRTEPLMGLRYRDVFLHDGRAVRVMEAVLMHGGEASGARDRFAALDRVTQESLIRYLESL